MAFVDEERFGPVAALSHGKRVLGLRAPLMKVRCYAVDGLMIDSGLYARRREIGAFAQSMGVQRVMITHHHEDHSNNARSLQAAGLPVMASEATAARVARGFITHPYQWLAWGVARRARLEVCEDLVETEHHRFQILPAPGHCEDQVVLYEPGEGWLFSGDLFLAPKVKLFRRDEDFRATVESLERLVALDFDALFCAHWPHPTGGRAALRGKLEHLREVEGQVRQLHEKGWSPRAISREVLGRPRLSWRILTLGDASGENMVRSILGGPRPRWR